MVWIAPASIFEIWQSLSCFRQGLAVEGAWKAGAALLWVCEDGGLLMDGNAVRGKVNVLFRDLNCKLMSFTVGANAEGMLCAWISMNFCGKGLRSLKDPLIPRTNQACAVTQQHKYTQFSLSSAEMPSLCSADLFFHSLNAWWHKDHHPSL